MKLFFPSHRALICLTPVLLFVLSTTTLGGCSRTKTGPKTRARATKTDDAQPTPTPTTRKADTLRILAFANYLSPKIVPSFEKTFNVSVELDSFENDEEFRSKWKDGEGDYDLVLPLQEQLLDILANKQAAPLERKAIPNLKHVDPKLLGPSYDKDNTYTIPHVYLPLMVLGVRTDHVTKPVKGLEVFSEEQYRGKIGLADQASQVVSTYLLHLGLSTGAADDASLAKVKELLLKHRPFIKEFATDSLLGQLEKGDIWLALEGIGNVDMEKFASGAHKNVRLLIPETGIPVWVDSFVIVRDAPMAEAAQMFLNHLLDPEISLLNAQETGLATLNSAARAKLDAPLRANPAKYPPPPAKAATLADWMLRIDRDEATSKKIEALWKEVKETKK